MVVLATRDPAVDQVRKSPLIGKPAPELHGTDLDGQSFNLANYASDFVLVNFFATWCAPIFTVLTLVGWVGSGGGP